MANYNPEQQQVIAHREGNLQVAAVAGAGKTTVVIQLIADIVKEGVNPNRILAATFSKKAATEMADRLEKVAPGCPARIGTLHSVCYEIVRDDSKWATYQVATEGETKTMLKIILGFQNMKWETADIDEVIQYVSKCKAVLYPIDEEESLDGVDPRYQEAYRKFVLQMQRERKLDFDDMIVYAFQHLHDDKSARARWQGKYDWVIVDEFQDTNAAQYEVVKILSEKTKLVVVGDDDQNIYEWRFTDPSFFTNFETNHKAKVIRMESNYRCGKAIGKHANQLIQNNKKRIVKTLRAEKPHNGSVTVNRLDDMDHEAEHVTDEIKKLMADKVPLEQIAVLYRTGIQSQGIAMELLTQGIPHIVIGGGNFFNRKEIKGLMGYIRAAMDKEGKDIEAWHNLINVPFRYLGKAFIDKWDGVSKGVGHEKGLEMMRGQPGVQARQRTSITTVLTTIRRVREMIFTEKCATADALRYVIDEVDFESWLTKDEGKGSGEDDRMGVVWRLVDMGQKFSTPGKFVDQVREASKPQSRNSDGKVVGKVQLMTIHRSKGLEFDHVFFVGVANGLIPHRMSDNEEEERRLAYVAMTRAREGLHMTYFQVGLNGRVGGPSRFFEEAGIATPDVGICPSSPDQKHLFEEGDNGRVNCEFCKMPEPEDWDDSEDRVSKDGPYSHLTNDQMWKLMQESALPQPIEEIMSHDEFLELSHDARDEIFSKYVDKNGMVDVGEFFKKNG